MFDSTIESTQSILKGQLVCLSLKAGHLIHCQQGRLWLTETAGGDVILQAGQSYQLRQTGLLLLENTEGQAAKFKIQPTQHALFTLLHRLSTRQHCRPTLVASPS